MLQTETWCRTCLGWRLSRHFMCGCLPQPSALIDELTSSCSLELFFCPTCLSPPPFHSTRPAELISRSRKQSLPVFVCKNAVHRWFSRQPSAVRSKVQVVNEWPERSSSRRSASSYPPFCSFFSTLHCRARDIRFFSTLWCGYMFFLLFFFFLLPYAVKGLASSRSSPCLDMLRVTPRHVYLCWNGWTFFRESAFYTWKKKRGGFFHLTLALALSKAIARVCVFVRCACTHAQTCCLMNVCALLTFNLCKLQTPIPLQSRFVFVATFSWVDSFLCFLSHLVCEFFRSDVTSVLPRIPQMQTHLNMNTATQCIACTLSLCATML